MEPARILIADDEPGIRFVLREMLAREGHLVEEAASGEDAVSKLAADRYDIVLADLKMPPGSGLDVLRALRAQNRDANVIIMTAYSTMESAIEALRLGAFDYLFKPVKFDEIRQRVREALLHRQKLAQKENMERQIESLRALLSEYNAPAPDSQRFLRSSELIVDRHHRTATLRGDLLDLTSAEFEVLVCIMEAAPNPVAPGEIVRKALGYEADETRAAETAKWYIHHLRRKIETDVARPRLIKTVRYRGYLWSGT
ncbi:MAG: response regulator transcription factor [Chloroflexota bacterium]